MGPSPFDLNTNKLEILPIFIDILGIIKMKIFYNDENIRNKTDRTTKT